MTTFACKRNSGGSTEKLLTIPLDGEKVRETEKALGLKINGEMVWLPKSQITEPKESDGEFSCWCAAWLIKEKKLEIFIDTSYEPGLFD